MNNSFILNKLDSSCIFGFTWEKKMGKNNFPLTSRIMVSLGTLAVKKKSSNTDYVTTKIVFCDLALI